MHWFEEKVWLPARRRKAEPDQARAWARVEALVPETLDRLGLQKLPTEVVFPGEAWATLIQHDAKRQYGEPYEKPEEVDEDLKNLQMELKDLRGSMAFSNFFAAYPEGKAIYRLNRTLIDALAAVKPPDDYPTEALSLPRRAVVIDLSETMVREHGLKLNVSMGVSYDLATGREAEGGLMLRFILIGDMPGMGIMPIPWADLDLEPGKTLRESLKEVGERFRVRLHALAKDLVQTCAQPELQARSEEIYAQLDGYARFTEDSRLTEAQMLAEYGAKEMKEHERERRLLDHFSLAVNALLYIQGEEDVVKVIHPGARPAKTSKNPEKAQRFKELAEPEVFEVGQRYAATIERWEIEEAEAKKEGGSGRAVRPHMRSAHPHLYWVGEGRKDARVRFLKPIAVKGGTDAEAPARIAPVM